MGRCYEFGPKIVEGCDHPMTAGPSSCSCEGCGAVCTGRFLGCADVWDKVPRPRHGEAPGSYQGLGTAPAGDSPDGAPPAPVDQLVPSGDLASDLASDLTSGEVTSDLTSDLASDLTSGELTSDLTSDLTVDKVHGTGMSVVLAHLFERVEALETVPAPDSAGAGTGAQAGTDAIAALANQLEHLTARLGSLDALDRRVGAMEHAVTAAPDEAVQLKSLEELAERTADELDQHTAATIERLDELAHGLERLSDRLQPLSTIPDRVEALERTAGEAIDALDQRLRGLEKTVADFGPALEELAGEVVGLGRLPARVEVLEQAEEPVTAEALDAVHTWIERLSDRTDAVEVLPQRVDALERAAFGGGPVHPRSRSIVADLDALGSQVEVVATAVDGVPRRLADVELVSVRTEALERGLAGAIDMIDQLVAQLGALEWACRPLPPPDEDDAAE